MNLRNLTLALGLAFSLPAWAGHIDCMNSNMNLFNYTGTAANDLEIRLSGITSAQVNSSACGGFYNGAFGTNPTVTDVTGGVVISWAGATISNGQAVQVGYNLLGNPAISNYSVTWTFNGVPIPPMPNTPLGGFQHWVFNGARWVTTDVLTNFDTSPMWVQRSVLTTAGVVTIDQLLAGGALDRASTLIDLSPLLLLPGNTLQYDFSMTPGLTSSSVMIYRLYSDIAGAPGVMTSTYFNSLAYVPEPASLALFGLGLSVLVMTKRPKGITAMA